MDIDRQALLGQKGEDQLGDIANEAIESGQNIGSVTLFQPKHQDLKLQG